MTNNERRDIMSLVYNKDGREYHINLKKDEVGEYVILPGDPKRCEVIAKYFDNAEKVMQNREYTTYTGYLSGRKVSAVSTGIGGASTAIAVEELANLGVHTFIRVGTSGGMALNVEAGDIVIANASIKLDGTPDEYVPKEVPAVADFFVTEALYKASKNLGYRYHIGTVQCKDSFYGQHSPETMPVSYDLINKWNAYIKCGALASEMESSTLFTVGAVRKLRTGTVLLVVGNQERRKKGLPEQLNYDVDMPVKAAVEAIKILIESDKNGK